jgi:hypothetical protein
MGRSRMGRSASVYKGRSSDRRRARSVPKVSEKERSGKDHSSRVGNVLAHLINARWTVS